MNKTLVAGFQILIGGALFGLIPIFVRYGVDVPAFQLVFFRAFFGSAFIILIGYFTGNRIKKFDRDRLKIICWSLILVIAIILYFFSLKYIDIASAVLLLNLNSVFIILFSRFWLKEKIHTSTLVSLVFSLSGAILIIFPSKIQLSPHIIGYLLAIGASLFTGLNFVFPKKYLKGHDPYSLTFYQTLWQLPFTLPFLFYQPMVFSIKTISLFAALGFFCSALAFLFIYTGSKNIKTQYIGILQTSESIIPIILGAFLFTEIPSTMVIIGGVLFIISYGVILFTNYME